MFGIQAFDETRNWARIFADAGESDSRSELARLLAETKPVADQIAIARKAAEDGDLDSRWQLAKLLALVGSEEQQREGVTILRSLVDQQHAKAMNTLGWCLANGAGIAKNEPQAVALYRKAADLGVVRAKINLARCLISTGTQEDKTVARNLYLEAAQHGHTDAQYSLADIIEYIEEERAVQWFEHAAESGELMAQLKLARMYQWKKPPDMSQAVHWTRKAAEQGYDRAQFDLAKFLARGDGCEKDEQQAVEWYRKAADQGNVEALFELAVCVENGVGVAQDQKAALELFERLQSEGHGVAALHIMKLRSAMTKSEMAPLSINKNNMKFIRREDLRVPRMLSSSTFGQAIKCSYGPDIRGTFVKVVVKVPKDPAISQEWLNEWMALSALPPHPHVINLVGLCENFTCMDDDGKICNPRLSFVTPSYEHGSIVDYFAQQSATQAGPGSTEQMLHWALDIASGLAHLHAHKMVHRDLAARNVFLDEDLRAVVGDLGLARELDAKGTYASEGKSEYPHPIDVAAEVHVENVYTPASDMFSYGLTLFEIATQCQYSDLFTWNTSDVSAQQAFANLKTASAEGYPALMSKLPATVPSEFKELILRCLHVDPSKRPSASEVTSLVITLHNDDVCVLLAVHAYKTLIQCASCSPTSWATFSQLRGKEM